MSREQRTIPIVTTVERDAFVSPTTNMVIFNLTTNVFQKWTGTTWVGADAAQAQPPPGINDTVTFYDNSGVLKSSEIFRFRETTFPGVMQININNATNPNTLAGAFTRSLIIVGQANTVNGSTEALIIGENNIVTSISRSAIFGYSNTMGSASGSIIVGALNNIPQLNTSMVVGQLNDYLGNISVSSIIGLQIDGGNAGASINATILTGSGFTMGNGSLANCIIAGGEHVFDNSNYTRVFGFGRNLKFPKISDSFVIGTFNVNSGTDKLFVIGNGVTDVTRSDAFYVTDTGDINVNRKIRVNEGANKAMGVATLVAGTVTVNTNQVTANSRIFLTGQNSSGTHGELTISARVPGTSFTITSTEAGDTRAVAWLIMEPGT